MASSIHDQFNASTWLVDRQVDAGRSLHPAIRCQGQTVTYAELLDLVNRAATGLRRLGVRPEERVGMVMLAMDRDLQAKLAQRKKKRQAQQKKEQAAEQERLEDGRFRN